MSKRRNLIKRSVEPERDKAQDSWLRKSVDKILGARQIPKKGSHPTYKREDPKSMVPGTAFHLKKRGRKKLIINRYTGEVVVKRRRDGKIMKNSKYARKPMR